MKSEELKNKSDKELSMLVQEMQDKLKHFRVLNSAGKLKNVKEIHLLRKDIARAKTFLSIREK